jgi:S-adenosylmethionine:tRNA ribosyltransferase-isomerase
MKLSNFDYYLPRELIAQKPIARREQSKLLAYVGKKIEHKKFTDILDYLKKGDTLVLNNSKVIPARIYGKKVSGGKVEILLLKKLKSKRWKALIKAKNMQEGSKVILNKDLYCTIIDKKYEIIVEFNKLITNYIKKHGEMPVPPYIKQKLKQQHRYQTVYANAKKEGSAAAPTAGLHFTNELLKKIKDKGVNICYITLHVGLGTFLPVKVDNIKEHKMHEEYFEISEKTAETINKTKGDVYAIGTTTLRALESASKNSKVKPTTTSTDIFIYPGYKFKSKVKYLITNFHLPKSTLLMLVSAFKGRKEIMKAYEEAKKEKYRFFSLGDAMLIDRKD